MNEVYRLPSDHEWSCAVGIGNLEDPAKLPKEKDQKLAGLFPWGKAWPPPANSGNYAGEELRPLMTEGRYLSARGVVPGYSDGYAATAPVGSYATNPLGLYDLGGNVWEWCEDWYDPSQKDRVLRGGCWNNSDRNNPLSSYRNHAPPVRRGNADGIRCVLASSASLAAPPPSSDTAAPARALAPAPAATPVPSSTPRATAAPATPTPRPASAAGTRPDAALAKATKDAPFVNSLGRKFVPVPGTKVLFCIHETRRQDYAAYDADVPGVDGSWKDQKEKGVPCGHENNHPVVGVSWEDAQTFCSWLSKKDGKHYRLPTDKEWSYAVGIGHVEKRTPEITPEALHDSVRNEFPWGHDFPPKTKDAAGNYADITSKEKFPDCLFIEGYNDGFATTSPVMSFKPNKLGLYDLGGNVWEWCEDWFNAAKVERVQRGGSWFHFSPPHLLSSCRFNSSPTARRNSVGFRCVVELPRP